MLWISTSSLFDVDMWKYMYMCPHSVRPYSIQLRNQELSTAHFSTVETILFGVKIHIHTKSQTQMGFAEGNIEY